jgi:hypothetical protein
MIKKIGVALALIVCIGGFIAYRMYHKPHVDIGQAPSTAEVTAVDLINAFTENEAQANEKYIGKTITVSGKVQSTRQEGDQVILSLQGTDEMSTVLCHLDPFHKHENLSWEPSTQVRLKGICSGYLSDVILERCIELK